MTAGRRPTSPTERAAIKAIERDGALLVFPFGNRAEPPSLWDRLFPGIPMEWDWSEAGDERVAALWHLRVRVSLSGRAVYSKWYQGRATFFSRDLFRVLLASVTTRETPALGIDSDALAILEALHNDSPLATKQLRAAAELEGRELAPTFQRSMKQLWERFLIVGYGELEEGGYPSLAVGATQLIFEDLWDESKQLDSARIPELASRYLPESSLFLRKFLRSLINPSRLS